MDDLWRRFMEALERRLGPGETATVAGALRLESVVADRVRLCARVDAFPPLRGAVRAEVARAWADALGHPVDVDVDLDPGGHAFASARLGERNTFETFVEGWCNGDAVDAARAAAEGASAGPVLLLGGSGLGKTHLLHAAGHACVARGGAVLLADAEMLGRALVVEAGADLRARIVARTDLLLLDGAEATARSGPLSAELVALLAAVHARGGAALVSFCTPPLYPWTGRGWPTVLLRHPEPPVLAAIGGARARALDVEVSDLLLARIAAQVRSVRELEGALRRLAALRAFYGEAVSEAFVRARAPELLEAPPPTLLTH